MIIYLGDKCREEFLINNTSLVFQLQPTCEELLTECKWQGRFKNCSDLFVTELTMDGYCCVFNYVSQRSTVKISPVVYVYTHYQIIRASFV